MLFRLQGIKSPKLTNSNNNLFTTYKYLNLTLKQKKLRESQNTESLNQQITKNLKISYRTQRNYLLKCNVISSQDTACRSEAKIEMNKQKLNLIQKSFRAETS